MKFSSKLLSFALCSFALGLATHAYAHEGHSQGTAAKTKSSKTSKPWIRTTQKANGSGIDLRYRLSGSAVSAQAFRSGHPVTVEIELSHAQSDASAEIRHTDGLRPGSSLKALKSANDGYALPLAAGKQIKTYSFTPDKDGLHYVYVQTAQEGKTSVVAIPIQVGTAPIVLPSHGEPKTTPSGEKIISLPGKAS